MSGTDGRKFDQESTAAEVVAGHDLRGKDVIVTGGASGLGAETARVLAGAGARVVIAGRDSGRGEQVAARLRAESGNDTLAFEQLDLGSLASVAGFAERYLATGRTLDILVNNAGVMACPLSRTDDGFEAQFGINHLGHFALALALVPALKAAGRARVVALSSRAHRRSDVDFEDPNYLSRSYDPWEAYGQSKTANALFAVGFTQHFADAGITANSLMPGAIMTDLQRHLSSDNLIAMGWADSAGNRITPSGWKTVEQGAATTVWAAVAPELEGRGGLYLDDCAVAQPWTKDDNPPTGYYLPYACDPERAERLWALSEKLVTA